MDRSATFDRYTRATDGPLTILALLMIPLLVGPLIFEVPANLAGAILVADWVIWATFAVDYVVRVYLSPKRWRFIVRNIPDLLIVLIPFLRPLRLLRSARLLRLLRLARLAAFASRGLTHLGAILRSRGLGYVLLIVLGLVFVAAAVVVEVEKGAEGSNIDNFVDAVWWALTTVTTVGYGDAFPVTMPGRGIAVFLMIAGIAMFGVLTATIAAYFVKTEEVDATQEVTLKGISDRLRTVEQRINAEAAFPSVLDMSERSRELHHQTVDVMSSLHDWIGEQIPRESPRELSEAEKFVATIHAGVHNIYRAVYYLITNWLQEEALILTRTLLQDATRLTYFQVNKTRLDEMHIRFTHDSLHQELELEKEAVAQGYEQTDDRIKTLEAERAYWESRATEIGMRRFGGLPDTRQMMESIGKPGRYWAFRRFSHPTHSSRVALAARRTRTPEGGEIIGFAADIGVLIMTSMYATISLIESHRAANDIIGFGDNASQVAQVQSFLDEMNHIIDKAGLTPPEN